MKKEKAIVVLLTLTSDLLRTVALIGGLMIFLQLYGVLAEGLPVMLTTGFIVVEGAVTALSHFAAEALEKAATRQRRIIRRWETSGRIVEEIEKKLREMAMEK